PSRSLHRGICLYRVTKQWESLPMPLTISFILAVRDGPHELLQTTLEGLLRTSDRDQREIVVIDDCSIVPLQIEHPDILVIRNAEPIGSARSRRTGASFASGDVLSFL